MKSLQTFKETLIFESVLRNLLTFFFRLALKLLTKSSLLPSQIFNFYRSLFFALVWRQRQPNHIHFATLRCYVTPRHDEIPLKRHSPIFLLDVFLEENFCDEKQTKRKSRNLSVQPKGTLPYTVSVHNHLKLEYSYIIVSHCLTIIDKDPCRSLCFFFRKNYFCFCQM